jgi:hypothetical protein
MGNLINSVFELRMQPASEKRIYLGYYLLLDMRKLKRE